MKFETEIRRVHCAGGNIAVHILGPEQGTPVVLTHSIMASSKMWECQMALLAGKGYRAIAIDTRGHGDSADAPKGAYRMDDLADDTVAVMDALGIEQAHYVGLSLGGMSGFGLGLRHAQRFLSLVLCDARADWPAPAVWEERIAAAREGGVAVLAQPTVVRWFGQAFVDAHPEVAKRFVDTISATSLDGFIGCAQAIQGLNYLNDVERIALPVTLIVGSNDKPLPDAMAEIQQRIAGSCLELIPDAGHLPNIDQPDAFDAALLRHFAALA